MYSILHRVCSLQIKRLPMLQTLVDYHIAITIGFHQEAGSPLTLKRLLLLGLSSSATVQRRLNRLIALGVIRKDSNPSDGRMLELKVTPLGNRLFSKYLKLLERIAGDPDRPPPSEPAPENLSDMYLITMGPEIRACGTCSFWQGARELRSGVFNIVEDSEGICRERADRGINILQTLTPPSRQEHCGHWQLAEAGA
ncbi:MAG: hypothetical protein PHX38_01205 [Sulfuricella sp.]|nr:hypothetical protein [Sulfuricella sp.]